MKYLNFKLYPIVLAVLSYSIITIASPTYYFDNRQSRNKYRLYLNDKLYPVEAHEKKCITDDAPSSVTKIEIRDENGHNFNPPLVKKFTPIFGNRNKNKIISFNRSNKGTILDVISTDETCS